MKKLSYNYNFNYILNKLCNVLMRKGKKALAFRVLDNILKYIYSITKKSPILILKKAIKKGRPLIGYTLDNKKFET